MERRRKIPFAEMSSTQQYDFMMRKQMSSCLLCLEGKKMRDQLADHFIVHHSGAIDADFIHLCKCPDSIEIQTQLLSHLLKHVLKKRLRFIKQTLPKEIINEDYNNDERDSVYNNDDPTNNSSDDDIEVVKETKVHKTINENKFNCDQCPGIYKSRKSFIKHVMSHKQTSFDCDVAECRKSFKAKQNLKNHKLNVHTKTLCDQCSMMIPTIRMKEHRLLHHSGLDPADKPLKCDVSGCKGAFRSRQALKYHQITAHSNERPFICEYCAKSFPAEINLRQHRQRHLEPDRFRCEECSQTFTEKISLLGHNQRKHPEKHLDDTPRKFACTYPDCTRKFVRQNHLIDHNQRVHVEGKSETYKPKRVEVYCSLCSKMFVRKYHLDRHMKNIHHIVKSKNGNEGEMFDLDYKF